MAGLGAQAQVLGNGSVDSTKIKNLPAEQPKAELKSFEVAPVKGKDSQQQPSDKKTEEPVLSPTGKPKTEE